MSSTEIYLQLQTVFQKVFRDSSLQISEQTTPKDIAKWQSLTHMELIDSIEKHYKIKFSLKEVISLQNVGDIVRLIETKTN